MKYWFFGLLLLVSCSSGNSIAIFDDGQFAFLVSENLEPGDVRVIDQNGVLSSGLLTFEFSGLQAYDDSYCNYLVDYGVWNPNCVHERKLVEFLSDGQPVFSILLTERPNSYIPSLAEITLRFNSPNSPFTNPETGIVNENKYQTKCFINRVGDHEVSINFNFNTPHNDGKYDEGQDYILIECDGEQGRPRIKDEIPEFVFDQIRINNEVFVNQETYSEFSETINIRELSLQRNAEVCGNGYCSPSEQNICKRDCGCSEGYLNWDSNTCLEGNPNLEHVGYYGSNEISHKEYSGNIRVTNQYSLYYERENFYFQLPNQGNFLRVNQLYDFLQNNIYEFKYLCSEILFNPNQFNAIKGVILADEPVHNGFKEGISEEETLNSLHEQARKVEAVYPDLRVGATFLRNVNPPANFDFIGLDPYIYPENTQGCNEYGLFLRNMYFDWNNKQITSLQHYKSFNKPLMLVGRAFGDRDNMLSACQQSWYYELAMGEPQIESLLYFAKNFDEDNNLGINDYFLEFCERCSQEDVDCEVCDKATEISQYHYDLSESYDEFVEYPSSFSEELEYALYDGNTPLLEENILPIRCHYQPIIVLDGEKIYCYTDEFSIKTNEGIRNFRVLQVPNPTTLHQFSVGMNEIFEYIVDNRHYELSFENFSHSLDVNSIGFYYSQNNSDDLQDIQFDISEEEVGLPFRIRLSYYDSINIYFDIVNSTIVSGVLGKTEFSLGSFVLFETTNNLFDSVPLVNNASILLSDARRFCQSVDSYWIYYINSQDRLYPFSLDTLTSQRNELLYDVLQLNFNQACENDLSANACSVNKPLRCEEGMLQPNCQECGCPTGLTCGSNGVCYGKKPKEKPRIETLQ